MKELFYSFLAMLGFWIPTRKCMPPKKYFDWVMISYVDAEGEGIRCLPMVAEYSYTNEFWRIYQDDDWTQYWINTDCVVDYWRRIPRMPFYNKTYKHWLKRYYTIPEETKLKEKTKNELRTEIFLKGQENYTIIYGINRN